MAKFCPNCGTGLADAANFCAGCGAQLASTPTQPAPQPVQYPQQPQYQPYPQQPYPPAPPPAPVKKKRKGLKIFLGIVGGLAGLVAVILVVALAATGGVAKKDYYTVGGDKIPSVKLALGGERKVTGVSTSASNGVTIKEYRYSAPDVDQALEMSQYLAHLRRQGFLLLTDADFNAPEAWCKVGRNSKDSGYQVVVQIEYDTAGYVITIVKESGSVTPNEPADEKPTLPEQTAAPFAQNTTQAERTVDTLFGELSQWDQEVLDLADECLELLKDKQWGALGSLVHRKQGLTFSPYGYVEDGAVRLGMGDVKALDTYAKVHTWGHFDGSGEPIEMTFAQYYDRFIFDRDFTRAPQVSVDKVIRTTMEENLYIFGNGGAFVEYHIPGSREDADHNWASLRLVFSWEEDVEGLSLVAVVHDEWTV